MWSSVFGLCMNWWRLASSSTRLSSIFSPSDYDKVTNSYENKSSSKTFLNVAQLPSKSKYQSTQDSPEYQNVLYRFCQSLPLILRLHGIDLVDGWSRVNVSFWIVALCGDWTSSSFSTLASCFGSECSWIGFCGQIVIVHDDVQRYRLCPPCISQTCKIIGCKLVKVSRSLPQNSHCDVLEEVEQTFREYIEIHLHFLEIFLLGSRKDFGVDLEWFLFDPKYSRSEKNFLKKCVIWWLWQI